MARLQYGAKNIPEKLNPLSRCTHVTDDRQIFATPLVKRITQSHLANKNDKNCIVHTFTSQKPRTYDGIRFIANKYMHLLRLQDYS